MVTVNGRPDTEETAHAKCFGNMFRENRRLTYGAMICDECEEVEECWEYSKSRRK